ncbi:unnamed protein product [Urochloa humidicola]
MICAAAPSASVMKQIRGRHESIESDQRLAATAVYPNPANPMVGASALEAPVTHHRLVTYHTADSPLSRSQASARHGAATATVGVGASFPCSKTLMHMDNGIASRSVCQFCQP